MNRIRLISMVLALYIILTMLCACQSYDIARESTADSSTIVTDSKNVTENAPVKAPDIITLRQPVSLATPAMYPITKVMTPSYQFIENITNGDAVYFRVPESWQVINEPSRNSYRQLSASGENAQEKLNLYGPISIDKNTAFDENFHGMTKRVGWDDYSDRAVSFFTTSKGYECILYTKEINRTIQLTAYVKIDDSYILVMEFFDMDSTVDLFLSIIDSVSSGNLNGSGEKCVFLFSAHGYRSYSNGEYANISEGREFTVSLPSNYVVGADKDLYCWKDDLSGTGSYVLLHTANYSQSGFFITRIDDGSSLEEYVQNKPADKTVNYTSDGAQYEESVCETVLSVHSSNSNGYEYCYTQKMYGSVVDYVYIKTADNYVIGIDITGWDSQKLERIIYSIR